MNYCGIDLAGVSSYAFVTDEKGNKRWAGPIATEKVPPPNPHPLPSPLFRGGGEMEEQERNLTNEESRVPRFSKPATWTFEEDSPQRNSGPRGPRWRMGAFS